MRKTYKQEELLNICPVCGWDELEEPPFNEYGFPSYEICPCCGFETGYHDSNLGYTFEKYREKWLEKGFPFLHIEDEKPQEWNELVLNRQLKNIEKVKHYVPAP